MKAIRPATFNATVLLFDNDELTIRRDEGLCSSFIGYFIKYSNSYYIIIILIVNLYFLECFYLCLDSVYFFCTSSICREPPIVEIDSDSFSRFITEYTRR